MADEHYVREQQWLQVKSSGTDEKASGSKENGVMRGVRALQELLRIVQSKEEKDIKADDLKVFAVWRHILSDEEEAQVATIRNKIMKRPLTTVKVPAPVETKKPKKAKVSACSQSQIEATARALLGMK
eukprot:3860442-Amphidinium_carterae.1